MKKYSVSVRFTAPYLQAKFSDKAKQELANPVVKNVLDKYASLHEGLDTKNEEELSWVHLSYIDDKGYYIPGIQFEGSLINSSKDFKVKSRKTSFKNYVKAGLFCDTERIYLNKMTPDYINESYPARKDGMRVRLLHPAFKAGLEVSFTLMSLDMDNLPSKIIKEILQNAGQRYAVGAWRPKFGRFEVVEFNEIS